MQSGAEHPPSAELTHLQSLISLTAPHSNRESNQEQPDIRLYNIVMTEKNNDK